MVAKPNYLNLRIEYLSLFESTVIFCEGYGVLSNSPTEKRSLEGGLKG